MSEQSILKELGARHERIEFNRCKILIQNADDIDDAQNQLLHRAKNIITRFDKTSDIKSLIITIYQLSAIKQHLKI